MEGVMIHHQSFMGIYDDCVSNPRDIRCQSTGARGVVTRMSDKGKPTRRRFVQLTGAAGIAGLAGCAGSDGGQETTTTGQGETTTAGGETTRTTAEASDWSPSERMTFVAWASRGGGSDTIVRQGYLRPIRQNDLLPVDARAINQTGGGGEAGMRYTLDQDPDGHTVLNVTTNLVVTPLSRDIGITYEDFTPIARMGVEPVLLVSRADDDRFNNMEEFAEYASNNRATVASFDVGSQDHTAAFLLGQETDMNIEVVPFSGGGEQVSALLGGDVDATVVQPSEVSSQRESGDIQYLMHFSGQQLDLYPDLPYVNQVFDTEIVVEQFRGTVVHGETPQPRVQYLRNLFRDIYETDEFKQYAENNNVNPAWLRGRDFNEYIEDVNQRFTRVFKENNLGIYSGN